MATKFVPITLGLIEEGEFIEQLELEFKHLQQQLIAYRRQFGEKAKKAKAVLTAKVEMQIIDPDDETYCVKTNIATTAPKRPSMVSLTIEGIDQTDGDVLFVRAEGSDADDPRQGKLFGREDVERD
jgi:hypothetical protein